jgi:DNA-binding CsgD family transcriptional regulator
MDANLLSDREIEVLKLVGQGKSNKDIAQELFISVNTVKVHLKNIFKKLNVTSRTEATLYAIEHKIIDSPIPETETAKILFPTFEKEALETNKIGLFLNKHKWVVILAVIVIILGLSTLISQSDFFPGPATTNNPLIDALDQEHWREVAPLSIPREQMAVVGWDNTIYAIGGVSQIGVSDSLEIYSLTSNSWTTLRSKPTAVYGAGAAILGGKIYVPGGLEANKGLTTKLEVYDPRTNQWEVKAPLPIPLAKYGIASYEGDLYLFGGWDGTKETDIVLRYNPNNDNWIELTPLPNARASSSAIVLGDSIFIVGGIFKGQPALDHEVYSPNLDNGSDNPWSRQLSLDDDVQFIGGQAISGTLFLFSVDKNGNIQIQNFSLQSNMWSTRTEEPVILPPKQSQLTSLGGHIFFLGGIDEAGNPSDRVVRYLAVFTIVLPMIVN